MSAATASSSAASRDAGRPARLLVVGVVCLGWMVGVVFRLWDLQVERSSQFAEKAARQHVSLIDMRAERGGIYDRNGAELALSSPVDSIAAFPEKMSDRDLAANLLAEVLERPRAEVRQQLQGDGFRWIARLAEPGQAERLREIGLQGLHFEKESKRYYPRGTVAAHALGFVSVDHLGQGGVELAYEEILAGKPGARQVHYDALRQRYETRIIDPPQPGADIYLTLDERIQAQAEESLAAAMAKTKARAGSIVVMDPQRGDVLAMADWPPFDPNVRPRSQEDLELRRSFAISRLYEPGSTFKLFTVATALDLGLTDPSELLDCQNGAIYVGRRRIRDHKKYGVLSVTEIIANSSNVGVIKIAQRIGAEKFAQYLQRFGFGEPTGIEVPGENPGLLRDWKVWRDGSVASIAMGQEVGVTPLQLAQAVSVFANGGKLVPVRIIDSIRHPSGEIERLEPGEARPVIRPETAAAMRMMMERTIEKGTATLARTVGYRVGGKTGTAQFIDPDTNGYADGKYIASFVGMAPINDPSIVAVIVLDSPVGDYYGGLVAAPVFPRLAAQSLRFRDVPPSEAPPPAPVRRPRLEQVADLAIQAEPPTPAVLAARDGVILVSGLSAAEPGAPALQLLPAGPVRLRVTAVEAPDLLGKTVREAASESAAMGLRLEMLGEGVVVRQEPPPGSAVEKGSVIRVTCGRMLAEGARR